MYVYVVKRGDSLSSIGRTYGIVPLEIEHLNGLSSTELMPGMNLLIPGPSATLMPYTAGARETVASVAMRFGVAPYILAGANALTPDAALAHGQILFVPRVIGLNTQIEANGYLIPSGTAEDAAAIRSSGALTFVTIFSYGVTADGAIAPLPSAQARAAAKAAHMDPILCVTNFDGTNFSTELAHTVLGNPGLREKVVQALLDTLGREEYTGVNLDFEHMAPDDREPYNAFVQQVADAVRPHGYTMSIALGPKTSDEPNAPWMGAFDYRTLGSIVDFLMLMTYEWGWVGGPPMAIAPIDQVRAVLNYATSLIDPRKILMGIPTYGYNWEIPDTPRKIATGLSPDAAMALAVSKGAVIRFDPRAASPTFRYYEGRQEHEVWFEDAKSILVKFDLVRSMNLRGVSFWVLGQSFTALWAALRDTFRVCQTR